MSGQVRGMPPPPQGNVKLRDGIWMSQKKTCYGAGGWPHDLYDIAIALTVHLLL